MATYRRLSVEDLVVGKPLPWNVFNSDSHLLLRQGYIIESQGQVEKLLTLGLYREQVREELEPSTTRAPARLSPFDTIAFFQKRLRNLFQEIGAGRCQNATELFRKFAHDVMEVLDLDADAALGALHLDDEHAYSITHPIHIAMLSDCIARRLDLSVADRVPLVCAALTANIGMLELQETLNRQKEPLSARQQEDIWSHPQRSVEILKGAGVVDTHWLETVLHHHERLNGSGYPDGLSGAAVNVGVRIISLADTYSAMIKPRAYRAELQAKDALKEIFMKRGGDIDETLALVFIKEVGIFPPGAFVRMADGEIGIVVKRGDDAMHPLVQAVLSPRGGPYTTPKTRKTHEELHQIREIVPREKTLALDLNRLWGYAR